MQTNATGTTERWQGTFHIVAPSAPPKICGVGDHSFHLASALSERGRVLVHCGQDRPLPEWGRCEVVVDFDHDHPQTLKAVADSPSIVAGDTVFVQYTNFAYGKYGWNPWLAPALRTLRRRGVRIVTMFHETYMNGSEGWKPWLMGQWQRHFFRQVGLTSDVCLFSTEAWSIRYAPWFHSSLVSFLPVASNIPLVPADKTVERARLGIPVGVPCLVVFGGTHPSRLFDWIAEASGKLTANAVEHRLLHVGPDESSVARLLAGSPLVELGILPADQVSRALTAGDVLLAPISDGASTRRGSLLAGLEHGLCCITTAGPGTDQILSSQDGLSLRFARDKKDFGEIVLDLATHPDRIAETGTRARAFYRSRFSWESIADDLLRLLTPAQSASHSRSAVERV